VLVEVLRETLDAGLAALFGSDGDVPASRPIPLSAAVPDSGIATAPAPELQAMITEARRRYQAAVDAQREGDWARYGEEIRELGSLLERLEAMRAPRP
jgi:uncharacterized membrane protein (UPF0182 family)